MRRFVGISVLAALLVAVGLSHSAWSVPPAGQGKQKICHVEKGATMGTVLEVAKSALVAHCNNHNDNFAAATAVVGATCTAPAANATLATRCPGVAAR